MTERVRTDEAVLDLENEVIRRYAAGATEVEDGLCCAVATYDPRFLEILPEEIIATDYGCGDPSRYAREGDAVLDLGSGSGKVCYILSQTVGPTGRVVGVDFNDTMLKLARKHQADLAERIGHDNVRFMKGRIQDLALDLDRLQTLLEQTPVADIEQLTRFEEERDRMRRDEPMIADASIDLVVSNCVLNLVPGPQKRQLFSEMFRVLARGGRAVISDIVCDEPPTARILGDPRLWSGCISGAFEEHEFVELFREAGFYGVEVLERQSEPWQVIDGIEFRSMTVRAFKGKDGACHERNQAVLYRGPFSAVEDDDGHRYERGRRVAVCDKTFRLLGDSNGPYAGAFFGIEPLRPVPLEEAAPFDCDAGAQRDPRVTKGLDYREDRLADGEACCEPGCC